MDKKKLLKIVYIIYLIALIAFIFSNSLPSIEESAQTSGRALNFLNKILDFLGLPIMSNDVIIRKAAHFIEFFVLGASIFMYTLFNNKPTKTTVVNCTFLSCLVAMTDETIQYFSKRGSMLLDVWLDLFAAATAILILFAFIKLKKSKL